MGIRKRPVISDLVNREDLWVFGYGSLIWNPGFKYCENRIGYIDGFSRKLYQGNVTHRGRPGLPGRVATLLEDQDSRVWGRSFHVVGLNEVRLCLEHLGLRECILGGYDIEFVEFHTSSRTLLNEKKSQSSKPLEALVFIALPSNHLYLGPGTCDEMARCIFQNEGASGCNLDYFLGILEFLQESVP
ncbi:hypothetical protein HELRODRAFT_78720, partial [Helobdella robusta]|uniref:glutathione-specific gamma-glutamylcyclotransferase n=1 Tax=Helobdella robusta TaxID=6412 RepID=T1G3F0_HELRO